MLKPSKGMIVLIDSDLDASKWMCDYLRPRGYEVTVTPSLDEGLLETSVRASCTNPIDLLIIDDRSIQLTRNELLERLKREGIKTPIILVSSDTASESMIQAIENGVKDYFVKPIAYPQLLLSINRCIHAYRREVLQERQNSVDNISSSNSTMRSVLQLAKRVAKCDATVLLQGESGTGKEVLAKLIHKNSRRADENFIAINCSALPENLLESELFGHARGSFTGADTAKIGLFEAADHGTLFLDEIGDLSLCLQAKLLRVLQDWKVRRVGENVYRDIDVRLIVATHKDLQQEVREKRFREDLFFRLNVIPIKIPPLRERIEDVLPLAQHFLRVFSETHRSNVKSFSEKSMNYLLHNPWKGNVRELENTINRAVILSQSPEIDVSDFYSHTEGLHPESEDPIKADLCLSLIEAHRASLKSELDLHEPKLQNEPSTHEAPSPTLNSMGGDLLSLKAFELQYVQRVLKHVHGVKDHAAKILQVDRKTLYRKLKGLDLDLGLSTDTQDVYLR